MSHWIWSHVFGLDWHCLGHNKKNLFVLLWHNLGWFLVSLFWLVYRWGVFYLLLFGVHSAKHLFWIIVTKIILYVYFSESDLFERLYPKNDLIQLCCVLSNVQTFICILIYKVLVRGLRCAELWIHHRTGFIVSNFKKKKWFPSKNCK